MSSPVTVLGVTVLWPTTGDINYSASTLQLQELLASAVEPIADLYNPNGPGGVGNLGYSDAGELTLNGVPVASAGTVTSVAVASATDLTVSGSPITTSGTINLDLTTTGVTPGAYTLSNVTVDSKGRITSISSGSSTVTPPAGANTQIQFNNSGVFGASANLTWDGTQQTIGGNLSFSGNARRIRPSTDVLANRLAFQSSATNGNTVVEFIPNGTSVTANVNFNQSSDTANTSLLSIGHNASGGFIAQTIRGTGTPQNLSITSAAGPTLVQLTPQNNLRLGNAVSPLATTATDGFPYIPIMSGVPTGVPTTVGSSAPLVVDTTNNQLRFYSSGAWRTPGTGTVTSVTVNGTAGNISSTGSPITSSGTITLDLENTLVSPGNYTSANITVDAKGRITSAANGSQGVWGAITGDIEDQTDLINIFSALGTAVLSTGVTNSNDTIGLIALNDTTLRFKAVTQAVFYDLIPTGINNAIRTFPQTDYPLASLPGIVADGIYIRFVGKNEAGAVIVSSSTFALDETTLQFGYIIVKRVGGVITFLDGAAGPRNIFTWPDFAGDNAALNTFLTPESDVKIIPNAALTVNNTSGVVKGLSINWGTGDVNTRPVTSAATTTFITINPSTALAITSPTPGTAVQVTQYWNGAAMTTMGNANNASVQRFLLTVAGNIIQQVGETFYTTLDDAVAAIGAAPFTNLLPADTLVELCRFAARRGATNLASAADAVFSYGGGTAGGGGTGAGTVTSVAIAGNQGVSSAGGPITTTGTITIGLGNITPTTVSTGDTTVAGNLTLSGASRFIRGDFSNATPTNKTNFQTSTVDGTTFVNAIPNGTGTGAGWSALNSNTVNYSAAVLYSSATDYGLLSAINGTGTALPMLFIQNGLRGICIDTSANVVIGGTSALATNSTGRFLWTNAMAGVPTGVPIFPTGYTAGGKAPITVDTTNNRLYFYSGGQWHSPLMTAGTVTSVNVAGVPGRITSSGGPITSSGTITMDLETSGVSQGSYTNANITVDAFGRITTAANGSAPLTPPAGGTNQVQYNNAGVFGASSDFTFSDVSDTLTIGAVTGTGTLALGNSSTTIVGNNTSLTLNQNTTIAGNLNFSGNTRRITGDMTNATIANRTIVQTSTVNGYTGLSVIPNGTSQTAQLELYANSNPTNTVSLIAFATGTHTGISSGITGTGTYGPMVFFSGSGGITGLTIDILGNVIIGGNTTGLATTATARFAYINSMAGTPTGVPTVPNGFSGAMNGKSPITVDITNGKIYFYSNSVWHDPTVIEQTIQTANYTTTQFDAGRHILHPSADTTARVFTIASNASVPYQIGTTLMFVNQNAAGVISIDIASDTMRLAGAGTTGVRQLAANGIATALKITSTEWIINGTGLT